MIEGEICTKVEDIGELQMINRSELDNSVGENLLMKIKESQVNRSRQLK